MEKLGKTFRNRKIVFVVGDWLEVRFPSIIRNHKPAHHLNDCCSIEIRDGGYSHMHFIYYM